MCALFSSGGRYRIDNARRVGYNKIYDISACAGKNDGFGVRQEGFIMQGINERRRRVRKMALSGIFAALVAVCSQVSIPLPSGVPITLQTAAVALTGYMLGVPGGVAALAVYIILGAAGVPVFSNLGAGFGVLLGKTGGFIFGFVPMAALCGLAAGRRSFAARIALGMGGLLVCHAFGVLQFAFLTGSGVVASAMLVSVPYLLKDVLSTFAACIIADRVRRAVSARGAEI